MLALTQPKSKQLFFCEAQGELEYVERKGPKTDTNRGPPVQIRKLFGTFSYDFVKTALDSRSEFECNSNNDDT